MIFINTDQDLVKYWFEEIRKSKLEYREPQLSEYTVIKLKLICDNLGQDSHVFLTSIDLLENYINKKNILQVKINDPLLLLLTIVNLSSKYTGDPSKFKLKSLVDIYEKLTEKRLQIASIRFMEIDVLCSIENNIPINTQLDDMKTFISHVMEPLEFKFSIFVLCEELINFYKMNETRLFVNLKIFYMQNVNAYLAFRALLTNRLYVMCGIVLSAFYLFNGEQVIDLDALLEGFQIISDIHSDHIQHLANEIYLLYKAKYKLFSIQCKH